MTTDPWPKVCGKLACQPITPAWTSWAAANTPPEAVEPGTCRRCHDGDCTPPDTLCPHCRNELRANATTAGRAVRAKYEARLAEEAAEQERVRLAAKAAADAGVTERKAARAATAAYRTQQRADVR
jgi:hypothetical protein